MPAEIQEKRHPRQLSRFMAPDRNLTGFITASRRITGEPDKVSLRGLFLRTKQAVPVGSVGKVGMEFKNWFFRATAVVRSVKPGRGWASNSSRCTRWTGRPSALSAVPNVGRQVENKITN